MTAATTVAHSPDLSGDNVVDWVEMFVPAMRYELFIENPDGIYLSKLLTLNPAWRVEFLGRFVIDDSEPSGARIFLVKDERCPVVWYGLEEMAELNPRYWVMPERLHSGSTFSPMSGEPFDSEEMNVEFRFFQSWSGMEELSFQEQKALFLEEIERDHTWLKKPGGSNVRGEDAGEGRSEP